MLAFYVWLIIELGFYAGVLFSGIMFLLVRSCRTGMILTLMTCQTFSATSDFLEASTYHLDLVLSFAAPLVVSSCLLLLNYNLDNKNVQANQAKTLLFYCLGMQVLQFAGMLFVSAVKFAQGATNRNWFYVYASITLTIFVVIPFVNLLAMLVFLVYYDFSAFYYWLFCYVLLGIGMIVWFIITILG